MRLSPRPPWRSIAVFACALGLAVTTTAKDANAHPLHTSFTTVHYDRNTQTLRLRIRVFADDFSAAVATSAGKPAPTDSSVTEHAAYAYLRTRVEVSGAGRPLELTPCGITREGEAYYICLTTQAAERLPIEIRNIVLCDFHRDQINVAKVTGRGPARTLLFARATPTQTLTVR